MKDLTGKKIVITGASSGIGESLAYNVAKRKGEPILVARNQSKLKNITQQIKHKYHVDAQYYVMDITDKYEWQKLMKTFPPIDVLINNAGIGYFEYFEIADWNHIEKMTRLNMEALLQTTYGLLPALKHKKRAQIINIGSQAGRIATPKSSVYSATKAFVISFSNALRLELKQHNIHVTTVNIGPVRTNFFQQADPEGSYQASVAKYMLDPEHVTSKVTKSILTKKREINLPLFMTIGSKIYQLFPTFMEFLLKGAFNKK